MSKITEGGKVIAQTTDGATRSGTLVTAKEPDVVTRALGWGLAAAGFAPGLLGADATTTTQYVKTDDGKTHEIKEVLHRDE